VTTPWTLKAYPVLHPAYQQCENHGIAEYWLAGLVSVECSSLNPRASRFEPGVFHAINIAKSGKTPAAFPGFAGKSALAQFIRHASVGDLTALASSYGLGQIMGYHYYAQWGMEPVQFENLTVLQSVDLTLKLMYAWLIAAEHAQPDDPYRALLRKWNTGSATKPANGVEKTFSPYYIPNAIKASIDYKNYLKMHPS